MLVQVLNILYEGQAVDRINGNLYDILFVVNDQINNFPQIPSVVLLIHATKDNLITYDLYKLKGSNMMYWNKLHIRILITSNLFITVQQKLNVCFTIKWKSVEDKLINSSDIAVILLHIFLCYNKRKPLIFKLTTKLIFIEPLRTKHFNSILIQFVIGLR